MWRPKYTGATKVPTPSVGTSSSSDQTIASIQIISLIRLAIAIHTHSHFKSQNLGWDTKS